MHDNSAHAKWLLMKNALVTIFAGENGKIQTLSATTLSAVNEVEDVSSPYVVNGSTLSMTTDQATTQILIITSTGTWRVVDGREI